MEVPMRLCNCAKCGMTFAFPLSVAERLDRCHNTFYCPAGHGNYYPQKSDVEIMQTRIEDRDRLISELKAKCDIVEDELQKLRRTRKARRNKK